MNQIKEYITSFINLSKALLLLVFLVGCKNTSKEINDFLADKNLPIGVVENLNNVHKDSGNVTSRLIAPILWDYSNRKLNPYWEFPKGVKIVSITKKTRDSITVTGDYAINYSETSFSEIIGNVVVVNHQNNSILNSDQMYWDKKENYFFTESPFILYTEKDTLNGVGFESESNLSNWILNDIKGDIDINNNKEDNE